MSNGPGPVELLEHLEMLAGQHDEIPACVAPQAVRKIARDWVTNKEMRSGAEALRVATRMVGALAWLRSQDARG